MIEARTEMFEDAKVSSCIRLWVTNRANKIVASKVGRETDRNQVTARRQSLHRESIQLDIKTTRAIGILAAAGQRRRIQNDRIEALARFAEIFRCIGMDEFHVFSTAVKLKIAPRPFDCARRGVDRNDLRGAPR